MIGEYIHVRFNHSQQQFNIKIGKDKRPTSMQPSRGLLWVRVA